MAESMDTEVKFQADKLREEGNNHFWRGDYEEAISKYETACKEYYYSKEWAGKTYCNIALCYMKLKKTKMAFEFAEKAVQLNSTSKAYYRRAQAEEELEQYEDSIEDYMSSYQKDPLNSTLIHAIRMAATHKLTICGLPVANRHQQLIQQSNPSCTNEKMSSKEAVRLYQQCIEDGAFGIIPFLKYVIKVEVSCSDIVEAISWPEHRDELLFMAKSRKSHLDYLRAKCQPHVPDTMGAELIKAAMIKEVSYVVDLFLNEFGIEGDVIDICELLKKTSLVYKPEWLAKMFERGAKMCTCKNNTVKIILEKDYERKQTQLRTIELLVENGASLNFDMSNTNILYKVTELTLQCKDHSSVHTLKLVCNRLNFETQRVCNKDGRSPWHLALDAKRKISIEVCKVLKEFPIDPSLKDKHGKRADHAYGQRETDIRVSILREKENEMNKNMQENSETTTGKKTRKRKENVSKPPTQITDTSDTKQATEIMADKKPTKFEKTKGHTTPVRQMSKQVTLTLTLAEIDKKLQQQLERIHKENDEYFIPNQHITPEHSSNTFPLKQDSHPSLHPAEMGKETMTTNDNNMEEGKSENIAEQIHDFDNQPWQIECSKKVMKALSGKKHKHLKSRFCNKMMVLAQGDFTSEKRCKSVSKIKGLELYETRLSGKERIIWQIVPQVILKNVKPNRMTDSCKLLDKPKRARKMYTDVIRVWDIVFDHDNIHHCVCSIEKNVWDRGHNATGMVPVRLKCHLTQSNMDGKTRSPRTYESDEREPETLFIPPLNPEENACSIARIYRFSTSVVRLMLRDGDIEKAFPYIEWPEEHDIININFEEAILLLGRSGTGKTTCCLYRLWNEFKHYWIRYSGEEFENIPKRQLSIASDTETVEAEDQLLLEPLPEEHNMKDVETPEDESDVCKYREESYDHLHQIFVTKNYALCSRLRKQFYKFIEAEEFAKNHLNEKGQELPCDLTKIHDLSYPLFLTARQLYLMLDYSLQDDKYFFNRDGKGNLKDKIVSTDYDHEDIDTLFDLEDSDDEEVVYDTFYTTSKECKTRTEVTAQYFEKHIWPKIHQSDNPMASLMVWMEIKSFIKGSREAIISDGGFLTKDEYEEVGKKAAPHFAGNRKEVYQVFEKYKQHIQNNPAKGLFDECDLVRHIFKRLPEARDELKWVLHKIYIDEVQDFTQGELWLLMHNCRDPNGFFFTGDTAQSIMSGIAFRFEDVKTLFHHMKQEVTCKVVVPKVKHLTTNFRAHAGILRLANSVTDVLQKYFPYSFDHRNLPCEVGLVDGPKPAFLYECSANDLVMVLVGHKQSAATIDFGAHQAILVRNKQAKENLLSEFDTAIVLTIFESKGLEFDDVLLYNFFTDSDCSEEWRVLASESRGEQQIRTYDKDVPFGYPHAKPHPIHFMEEKHKRLGSELKNLYTAITRTKSKLWFYESEQRDTHHPVLWYWKQNGDLVDVKNFSETSDKSEVFAPSSTPEDWIARGDEFCKLKLWEAAKKCFQKGSHYDKVKECEVFIHLQGNQSHKYMLAAISSLESDEIVHTPKALERTAKCLYRAERYEDAANLFRRLKEMKNAMKCYKLAKKFDQYITMLEEHHSHREVVEIIFKTEKVKAVELASRYIKQSNLKPTELKAPIIQHGMKLIRQLLANGCKDELLAIIDIIEPKLQVDYLTEVGAYKQATDHLKALGKTEDAYILMLSQAMYRQALDLARQLRDCSKVHQVLLFATKSKLSKCPMPACHTEVPDLQGQLEQLCQSDSIVETSVKGMAYLLLGRLTKDDKFCEEALKLFIKSKNTVGESEAQVILEPKKKKDLEYIELVVKLCVKMKKICAAFKTVLDRQTASYTSILHQVEDFYGLVKAGEKYHFPLHQDIWDIHLSLDRPTLDQIVYPELRKAICCHLEVNMKRLIGSEEIYKPLQNLMEPFKFHHKQIVTHSSYNRKKLLEYIKAYSLSLEIAEYRQAPNLTTWVRYYLDLFNVNGLLLLQLDQQHFSVVRSFPSAVGVLKQRVELALKEPMNTINIEDWMTLWFLSRVITGDDLEISQFLNQQKYTTENKHHFIYVAKGQHVPHFSKWIYSCKQLRQGEMALKAVNVLIHHMEIIVRRRSIHGNISCVSNIIFMIGVGTMILYAFLKFTLHPKICIVIPQCLVEVMDCFDRINSQKKHHNKLFQSCFSTLKKIPAERAKVTALQGIERMFKVFIGVHDELNILQKAAENKQKNITTMSIALGLTLLGNMSLSNIYKPSDLQTYQVYIWKALQPLMKKPEHSLRSVFQRFEVCTSSREIFTLVQELNKLYHGMCERKFFQGDTSVSDLFLIQCTKFKFQLTPTFSRRIPQNSMLPLRFKMPTLPEDGGANCKQSPILTGTEVTTTGMPEEETKLPLGDTKLSGKDRMPVDGNNLPRDITLPSNLFRKVNQVPESATEPQDNVCETEKPDGADLERLDSTSSNEYDYEDEIDIEIDDAPQRQVSLDKTIVDEEFCRACNKGLVPDEESLRDHVISEDHKRMENEYKRFMQTVERVTENRHKWEEEMGKWKSLSESMPLAKEVHNVREQVRNLEKVKNETERSGDWKRGEEELTRITEQLGHLTLEIESLTTTSNDKDLNQTDVHVSSAEEEFSDIEIDEVTSLKKRRTRRRGNKKK